MVTDELDDETELISVEMLPIREVVTPEYDAFATNALELKKLVGTTPNFKRRVTSELKKFHRGSSGVSSKAIEGQEYLTGYDLLGVVEPPYNLESLAKTYEMSSANYAACNAKAANIVGLGYKLVETPSTKRAMEALEDSDEDTSDRLRKLRRKLDRIRDELYHIIEDFNEEETFIEIMIKVWKDYEATGNGYIEIGRDEDGTVGYMGHVHAPSIRIRRDRDGFVQISGNKTQFFQNFGDEQMPNPIGSDQSPNELIHIKKYSPTSRYYGIPDIVAAQQAVAGNEFSARFNLDYFENKAVPRHIITLKGAKLADSAKRNLLEFFETGLRGKNHRSLFIPLPNAPDGQPVELKIQPVEAGEQDASFNNYRKSNQNEILMAHRVPVTKVSVADGASLAVARDADKTFKEQVCVPEQKVVEKKLNRIIREFTDDFELKLNEMTLTDANTQSQIDERMVKTGIWLANEPRVRDGMPTIEGGDTRVDLNAKARTAAVQSNTPRERDSVRSANATDSAGEGRNPKGDGRTTP